MVKYFRKNLSLSSLWVSQNDRLSDFYASSWQSGDSPIPMLVVRLVLALVSVSILCWSIWNSPSPYWLIYLTNLGFLSITAMSLSGLAVSISMLGKNRSDDSSTLPWYVSLYWFIYNVTISVAVVITVLYWVLLYDPDAEYENPWSFWLDVSTHGFNSVLALTELFVSRTPMRLLHIYQPFGFALWYAAFTAIYYAAGGTDGNGLPYIYEVLDWRQGARSGIIVASAMGGLVAIYMLLTAATFGREKLSSLLVRTHSHDLPFTPSDSDVRYFV